MNRRSRRNHHASFASIHTVIMDYLWLHFLPQQTGHIFYVTLKVELDKNHDAVYSSLFQVCRSLRPRYPKSCKFLCPHIPVLLKEHPFLPNVPSKHLSGPCAEYCVNKIKRLPGSTNVGINRWKWNYKHNLILPLLLGKCKDTSSPVLNASEQLSHSGAKWYLALE